MENLSTGCKKHIWDQDGNCRNADGYNSRPLEQDQVKDNSASPVDKV